MLNTIIVQCPQLHTTHAQLTYHSTHLLVEYGKRVIVPQPRFMSITKFTLWFTEFPELRNLHDGVGWNSNALQEFVNSRQPEPPANGRIFVRKQVS